MAEREEPYYEVIVGNIGTAYAGFDIARARQLFAEYVLKSRSGYGRAGGESVVLLVDDDVIEEFRGAHELLADFESA